LRVNTLRTTPEAVWGLLVSQGYNVTFSPLSHDLLLVDNLPQPGRLREALLGYYHPQALTSALVSLSLAPQPGELVCDLCAAPGSKTSHMAQLMRNQGVIVANEPTRERLFMLVYNLKHLGISNVVTTRYAGQNFPLRCKFGRVLVDAPCSGEGNYRWDKHGRQRRAHYSAGTPEDLPRLQKQLLIRGFDLLEPGGSLLYATCTYNPMENEAVVQALLEQRPATLQPITLPVQHSPGLQQWQEQTYDERMQLCWRLYPHQTGSVGFFVASIRA
jgi:NOL1/NOP2/sun family putative RNA methylase